MKLEQPVNENYPKHQDLSGIPTEKLKAYLAKQSSGEGNQIKRVRAELQHREQQGVAEGLETVADIDKQIEFHKQGQAAAQYKGSMKKL